MLDEMTLIRGWTAETEEELRRMAPDSTLNPAWFAASVTKRAVLLTGAAGIDMRFRGVDLRIGKSPFRELVFNLEQTDDVTDRFRSPKRPDPLLGIPASTIEIPLTRAQLIGLSEVPTFGWQRSKKIFFPRTGGVQVTMNVLVP